MEKKSEPAIVDCGFIPNRWGGWWYRAPSNAYTIQIIPTNTIHEKRNWKLGIARPKVAPRRDGPRRRNHGGMKWGKMEFPAPEAAALHACRVVHDEGLRDRIAQAMTDNHYQRESAIKHAIDNFMMNK